MPVEFVVRLNDDGTVTWFGLSLDTPDGGTAYNVPPSDVAEAVAAIQEAFPGSTVLDDASDDSKPSASVADLIKAAPSHDALAELWRGHRDQWTAEHNKLAANRKKELGK
jgi:hypothetical protein